MLLPDFDRADRIGDRRDEKESKKKQRRHGRGVLLSKRLIYMVGAMVAATGILVALIICTDEGFTEYGPGTNCFKLKLGIGIGAVGLGLMI